MEADENPSFCQRFLLFLKFHWQGVILFLTPIICSPLLTLDPKTEFRCCFILCIMAVFWICEVLPLGVTALMPIAFFPLLGIMDSDAVCYANFKDALFLFIGSLAVATAVTQSGLNKRMAVSVILLVGCSPRRLHVSLMFMTMFISMWITNAAATAMMCPVIKAVLEELENQGMIELNDKEKVLREDEPPYPSRPVICYYLGVAYAASMGGLGTLIGTGTNLVFKGIFDNKFPDADAINFVNFMFYNVPPMVINTALSCLILQIHFMGLFQPKSKEYAMTNVGPEGIAIATNVIKEKQESMGKTSCHEYQVGILFFIMICLFLTRSPGFFPGYADLLNTVDIKASFAIFSVIILLFVLPVHYLFLKYIVGKKPPPEKEGPLVSLLDWTSFNKTHQWNFMFLMSGGFALSTGISVSGFAALAGSTLSVFHHLPSYLVQLFCIVLSCFATAFTSNMAMCNILMPIYIEMCLAIRVNPVYVCLPAGLALSLAFHLPVSTPPNAIISAFADIRTKDMAIGGIGPTIINLLVHFIFAQTWGLVIYPDMHEFPAWAEAQTSGTGAGPGGEPGPPG